MGNDRHRLYIQHHHHLSFCTILFLQQCDLERLLCYKHSITPPAAAGSRQSTALSLCFLAGCCLCFFLHAITHWATEAEYLLSSLHLLSKFSMFKAWAPFLQAAVYRSRACCETAPTHLSRQGEQWERERQKIDGEVNRDWGGVVMVVVAVGPCNLFCLPGF